ncbi:E3 ubiquitin-protein ligase TRIM56-like [Lytechinus variegatus]|uniref:E3 ubiquitin-protein ligase TRIM56-like n=1 Tax=Lytechinus variegatus TaxID=7654 RepID=UPI001BB2ADB4|nr:E3 ubiquitin-protein ligase TRIM56-like [Lytechinus variegatus]
MAEASEKEKDGMNCAVCMDKLTNAKYLKCFHSFCTRCLEHCVRNLKVSCPLCREVTSVPRGIDSLLPNLKATRRVSEAKVRKRIETKIQDSGCQCGSCKELGAICLAKSYCVDCELLICDACVSAHELLKMTRSHRIIRVLDFQNGATVDEGEPVCEVGILEIKCEKHSSPLTKFCRSCNRAVCPECAVEEHPSKHNEHECVSIVEVEGKLTGDLKQLLSKIDTNHFDRVSNSYKQRLQKSADKAQELKGKINESAQNEVASLYAKIEAKRVDLTARILDIEKASSRKVATVLSGIRRIRGRAEKLESYADELLKTGNTVDILTVKDTVTEHLKDIRAEMRKLTTDDSEIDALDGYTFTATDWMSANYEPGVGRLEAPTQRGEMDCSVTGVFKRRTSTRMIRSTQRTQPTLPRLNNNPRSLVN